MVDSHRWTIERAARAAHADVLALLGAQYAEHDIAFEPSWLADTAERLLDDSELGSLLLVRDAEGRAVALAALSFIASLEEGGTVAWLDELYVLPELRCRGLGSALLERACALAADSGCKAVELEVTADHRRAEHLYQRSGFVPRERSRWYRRLGPSAPRRPQNLLDHISLGVSDLARSRAFYDAALAPLGLIAHPTTRGDVAYGPHGPHPTEGFALYIGFENPPAQRPVTPSAGFHLALRAPHRAAVDAFHRAALACGGKDYGSPGLRPQYHPDYYAAFARDPDGHIIEVVCHTATLSGTREAL
jgi:catechol 2,3-dioxygenase-like lactoylglutathione lyase family enzyme/GNAT superfamily N-acetyltransferase